jgi:hypothetical protein
MDTKVLNASIAYVEALKRSMDKGEAGAAPARRATAAARTSAPS